MSVEEEWRPFNETFDVSSLGRVRRRTDSKRVKAGHVMKPTLASHGYLSFKNSDRRTILVHHAVAKAFIGPRPDGMHINHIDGSKTNNVYTNLEYVTPRRNAEHASEMGLSASGDRHKSRTKPESVMRGERHGCHRLTDAQVSEARTRAANGESARSIAKEFGVSDGTVRHAVRGMAWAHVATDPVAKKFVARGEQLGTSKLTEEKVREIRRLHAAGIPQVEIAKQFGVRQTNISMIVCRHTWRHVT